jgi:hypothetical protein
MALITFAHVVNLVARLGHDIEHLATCVSGARRHRVHGRRLVAVAGQIRQKPLDRVERLLVGVHRKVSQPGDAGQQLPAAELFRGYRLVDRD